MNKAWKANCRRLGAATVLLLAGVLQAQTVPTYKVGVDTQASGFALEGTLQAVHQATVSAQTQGRVLTLKVKVGDRVKAGQTLATLDDREAQVGTERSQAQMAQALAEFRNAQTQWERTRELQQKGFVSKAALDTAATQLEAARAGKDQAQASVKLSGIAQGYARVVAPFDGLVLQTHVQAGDLAVPGAPLLTVYAPQPLRAVVQVPQSRAEDAKVARDISVEQDSVNAAVRITPTTRQIVPSADPVSQTTEWRLDLSPKDTATMLPGQPVRVRFAGGAAATPQRITIPTQALVRRGELTAVYVAQAQGYALRAVRTGALVGAQSVEIVAGLRAGERIALDPVKAAAAR
ncbi:efflux RND transporter periplasmic adaptor subunit [Curvibacter sp. APW13]|uniref:efflux RND transporter periplasmic adaptor subunit n=1 Tax=Curvibacter sp. APW13 TaxID=3077236 RepID=UPI0028DD6E7D|nr:efflux RND transporter periplasmic adaptor subunit [Curvibacter sp. APW13]MDT8990048.1 efflux RND transporter periplasmic adaptor subunit [Curvibacter sp. APW13]